MKNILVTTSWDDGHILDIKLSKLLEKYGFKGTFYVSPLDRELKKADRLSDEQILEISNKFEIGAHTMTHPHLTDIGEEDAKTEIIESKKYLENILGKEVKSFCYPAGYYKNIHKDIVKQAGFLFARNVNRFYTSFSFDHFDARTTIHAYRHYSDAWSILKNVGILNFWKCYLNWDELAINIFDKLENTGGIFHIWGHSWEIENNKDWNRLEKVLSHISNKSGVQYVNNIDLI